MPLLLLLPIVATAQPVQGLYFGLGAGANLAGDLLSAHETTKVYTTVGPVGLADLGWGFGNGLRAEIEGSYRSNSVGGVSTRRVNGLLEPLGHVGGDASSYAVMANLAYDIPLHPFGLQPYVGAGAGYSWLDAGNLRGNGLGIFHGPGNVTTTTPDVATFGTAGAFAYQTMAGTSIPLAFLPGLSATLEYRFFGTMRADLPVSRVSSLTGDTVNSVLPSNSTHNGFFVSNHAILIGLRYSFGGSPALSPVVAAAPPPAPAEARSYQVFFDWVTATLTNRARQVIAEAASAWSRVATTRIETNGYTDSSGSARRNQALSIRRAEAVAAELVRHGVAKTAISIHGFGETRLLVATGPGVREPQNRRVEIIIR